MTSPSCLYRLSKRFAVSQPLLSPPPCCCWHPVPNIQPAHLGTVPGHCSLPDNEAADAAAVRGPFVSDRGLGTDVCSCLRRAILSSWQAEWHVALGKTLRMVTPSVKEWQSSFRAVRKAEVTLTCLRIAHTGLTHGQPAPVCTHSGVPLTVAHISVHCPRCTLTEWFPT
jgi:hypothetical protein